MERNIYISVYMYKVYTLIHYMYITAFIHIITYHKHLHNNTRYVCMLPMAGRTNGPIKTKLCIGTHVDPRTVLVKVKVIYLCVRYNRIHDSDTWRTTMKHVCSSSSHLVNANKTHYLGLFAPSELVVYILSR